MNNAPFALRRDLALAALAALVALALLAGCAGGSPSTPTPIPADVVRPAQPTPLYSTARPQFRMDTATRTPIFVPTADATAAAATAQAPLPATGARRSLLQALLMDQPPSAMGIAPGGATIFDAPGGAPLASVPAAGGVTVTGRSADGAWLAVYTDAAEAGWVSAGSLQLYGADDLTTVTKAFSPAPVATMIAEAMLPVGTPLETVVAARSTAIAQGGAAALDATPAPAPAAAASADLTAIQVGVVSSSGNLNLRATPSSTATVVAALPPQAQVIALARTAQGDWLRVRTPTGDGWVDARYITLQGAADLLPVEE